MYNVNLQKITLMQGLLKEKSEIERLQREFKILSEQISKAHRLDHREDRSSNTPRHFEYQI